MYSWPSAAAQIQENPFEPDGRLRVAKYPIVLDHKNYIPNCRD